MPVNQSDNAHSHWGAGSGVNSGIRGSSKKVSITRISFMVFLFSQAVERIRRKARERRCASICHSKGKI